MVPTIHGPTTQRPYSLFAKTFARNSDLFFYPSREEGSSDLGFTNAWPLTYGAHLTWAYTTWTVYFPA